MPEDIHVQVGFDNPPPRKRSKLWDIACILLACGILGAVSNTAWVFPVLAFIMLTLYAFTEGHLRNNSSATHNSDSDTDTPPR
jgi:hypothetical protein